MNEKINRLCVLGIVLLFIACKDVKTSNSNKQANLTPTPNIIVIYTDDLGYGDVSSYGVGTLQTPNIDRIANEGIRFTNGYATSATCTPSRYALLTGQYPWRNERASILKGDAPLLIDTTKQTLPSMLREANYTTAVVGKWHLGLGNGNIDWNSEIELGPNEIGFDYSYVMASTNDRVPSVYVENHNVVGLDSSEAPLEVSYKENFQREFTGKENRDLLKMMYSHGHDNSIHNGISRIGYMRGGKSALWIDEDVADTILVRAKEFIKTNTDKPFFLYYALHQPHVPRVPHPRFVGSSGMGPRGDAIVEADWCIGEILNTLKELGIDENTMVIFSSDNGPVLDDGYVDNAQEKLGDHTPAGIMRGGKYSLFDAGTRVPFMVRWPGVIQPAVSDAMVCQIDLLASFAKMTQQKNKSIDSQDLLDVFLGKSDLGRNDLVLEAGRKVCYREGDWVLIPPYKGPKIVNKWVKNETGILNTYQLYNIKEDRKQQSNLAEVYPERVTQMKNKLEKIKNNENAEN